MVLVTASTAPGVYYEHVDDSEPVLRVGRTDIAGFVGVAAKGPVGASVPITSPRQFDGLYGTSTQGFLRAAVHGFFDNGGRECHVVRAAAPERLTMPDATVALDPTGMTTTVVSPLGCRPGVVVGTQLVAPPVVLTRVVTAIRRHDRTIELDVALPPTLWSDQPIIIRAPSGLLTATHADARQPADGQALVLRSVRALTVGDNITIEQHHRVRHAQHRITSIENRTISWSPPLSPAMAAEPGLVISTGARMASGTLLNELGRPLVNFSARSPGVWGNQLEVRAVVASRVSTTTVPSDTNSGPATATEVHDLTNFSRGDLVELRRQNSGGRGRSFRALVAGIDPDRNLLIWDPGPVPGRPVWARPLDATVDQTQTFHLRRIDLDIVVADRGEIVAAVAGASLVPGHPRELGPALDGEVAPPSAGRPMPTALTDIARSSVRAEVVQPLGEGLEPDQLIPLAQRIRLQGGGEGLAGVEPHDLIGLTVADGSSAGRTRGLASLDLDDAVAILGVPDAHLRPTDEPRFTPEVPDPCPCPADRPAPEPTDLAERPPRFSFDDTARIQRGVVDQCERRRDRFGVLAVPHDPLNVPQAATALARRWRTRFDTNFAALYYPWLEVLDPAAARRTRELPSVGHVMGTYARADLSEGPQRAPANLALRGVHRVTTPITDALRGDLNRIHLNCLVAQPGRGLRAMGARTLSSDPVWRYVNVRRLLSAIEESVDEGLQWAVFRPNDVELRQLVSLALRSLLDQFWRRGALRGETAEQAFYVRCDETNNPDSVTGISRLVADVGVAAASPGEFVFFRVGRTEDELRINEYRLNAGESASSGVAP